MEHFRYGIVLDTTTNLINRHEYIAEFWGITGIVNDAHLGNFCENPITGLIICGVFMWGVPFKCHRCKLTQYIVMAVN